MTVKEFIEYLKTLDENLVVQIVEHESGCHYYEQGGTARAAVFDASKHVDVYNGTVTFGEYNG